jgi:prophage antirepressor-like protein
MANIQIFKSDMFGNVRGINVDGEPWLVGKDVAIALRYKDTVNALKSHVDEDDKKGWRITTPSRGEQNAVIINESGMYSLIFGSKLPNAKKFKHWVTSVVLPAIRKNGYYSMSDADDKTEAITVEGGFETSMNLAMDLLNKIPTLRDSYKLDFLKMNFENTGVKFPHYLSDNGAYRIETLLDECGIDVHDFNSQNIYEVLYQNHLITKPSYIVDQGKQCIVPLCQLTQTGLKFGTNIWHEEYRSYIPLFYYKFFQELVEVLTANAKVPF